jgi:hypothetical protein
MPSVGDGNCVRVLCRDVCGGRARVVLGFGVELIAVAGVMLSVRFSDPLSIAV